MSWTDPDLSFVDSIVGGLFATLKSVCAPAAEKPYPALVRFEGEVNGKTPGVALEHMHEGMQEIGRAGDKYGIGDTACNDLKAAVDKWRTDAPKADQLNGLEAKVSDAYKARDAEIAKDHPDDAELDRLKTALDIATDNLNTKVAKRNEVDQTLKDAIGSVEAVVVKEAGSLGIPDDVLKGRDSSLSDSGTPNSHDGTTTITPHAVPQPAPSPRMSPSGAPGAGDFPGTAPKDPAAKAALAKLLAENPSNAQVQQPQPTGTPMSTPATQTKPADKKQESPLDRMLREAGITPPSDADTPPDLVAGVVPGAPAAAPAPAAVNPPAPKAQVGGGSYSNGVTTTNVSGGQNRAPMTLASAVPVQETVNPAQRTGGQQPMGQGGLPMGAGLGGQPTQNSGKEQPRVQLYTRKSESELVASGAYTIAEAVRAGTLCRGDHEDEDDAKNAGPRKR